jgi:hypothetical protein
MLWFEESVKITPEFADRLRLLLLLPAVGLYCSVGLVLLGLIMMAVIAVPKSLGTVRWKLPLRLKR